MLQDQDYAADHANHNSNFHTNGQRNLWGEEREGWINTFLIIHRNQGRLLVTMAAPKPARSSHQARIFHIKANSSHSKSSRAAMKMTLDMTVWGSQEM